MNDTRQSIIDQISWKQAPDTSKLSLQYAFRRPDHSGTSVYHENSASCLKLHGGVQLSPPTFPLTPIQ